VSEEKLTEDVPAEEMAEIEAQDGEAEDMETAEEPSLEEQLEAAKEEAAKNLDSFLRAQAELSNARKRFEKQQAQVYTNANADLVLKLLPVLDDFDRAMESVPDEISAESWFEGIELVHRKLLGILENLNVQEIEAVGQPFDPNFHDALAQEPSDDHESGIVTREMVKGYRLGDRVVRPSLVYVAE
jgi:molecular chaperone GrpE